MRIPGINIPSQRKRWTATTFAARLGVIAATLSGVALALHLGGQDGYTVPMSILLGMPSDVILLRLIPHFALTSAGPDSVWNLNHLAFCATIAINWTFVGVAMDVARFVQDGPASPTPIDSAQPPSLLTDGEHDLRAEFDALERAVRERETRAEPRSARRAA